VVKTTDNAEGVKVPADMFVVASGCHYNLNPPFLQELGIGEISQAVANHHYTGVVCCTCLDAHNSLACRRLPLSPVTQVSMTSTTTASWDATRASALHPTLCSVSNWGLHLTCTLE